MKKSLLAVSMAAAMGLGASQNALADVYAYAFNDLFNLTITSSTGIIPTSSVFSLSNSASLTPGGNDINSQSFSAGTAPFNIADANVGIASTTSFAQNGNKNANYARGDATIITSELNPGQPPSVTGNKTQVQSVAESYLNTNGQGQGVGKVGSVSSFTFIAAAPGTTLSFSFDAILNLVACVDGNGAGGGAPPLPANECVDSNAVFPSNAQASSAVSFTIQNTAGAKVFEWNPGSATGTGLASSVNPFNLNNSSSRDQNVGGLAQITGNTTTGGTPFSATTVGLAAGTYTLSLVDTKTVVTELANGVPEPETLALMGIGLLGGFFVNRRKIGAAGKKA